MPPLVENPGSEPLFYKIDYDTALLQGESAFCNIPNEILLEIAKYLFAGFGLEFWNQGDQPSDIVIRAAEGFEVAGLKILRLCKVVRQKLLPLLVAVMNLTLKIFDHRQSWTYEKPCRDRLVPDVKLAPKFRTAITSLELDDSAEFLPHPASLKTLKMITVHLNFTGVLDFRTFDDDAQVLKACRRTLGIRPGGMGSLSWLFKLGKIANSCEPSGAIQVVAAQRFYSQDASDVQQDRGRVYHDVVSKVVVKKVELDGTDRAEISSATPYQSLGFWKPPPIVSGETHIRPTSV